MIAGRLLHTRARRWGALAVVVLLIAAVAWIAWPQSGPAPIHAQDERITVRGGPGVGHDVTLDAGLYLPTHTPAPAVIVAHGFGGSRASVDGQAQRLARDGFVVLTYSARGFGQSTGRVGLDSLDYEVPDARQLVDWLAQRPEVIQDGAGDPRVGVTGGSYGGALALMLAGTDPRVDAVAAVATWNDLTQSLFPNNADTGMTTSSGDSPSRTPADIPAGRDGVFKQAWAAALMASVLSGAPLPSRGEQAAPGSQAPGGAAPGGAAPGSQAPGNDAGSGDRHGGRGRAGAGHPDSSTDGGCGRLMPEICAAYTQVAETGRLTPAMGSLLENSSPEQVVSDITAPTLLVQGEQDTLFGLDQADANARAIAANGTPVAMTWFAGGHSGGDLGDAGEDRITDWFRSYLADEGSAPSRAFQYTVAGPLNDRGRARHRTLELPHYPGIEGGAPVPEAPVPLTGPAQQILQPPGGEPAAISSLPGLGSLGARAVGLLSAPPGQSAMFVSKPVDATTVVTGSPTVTLRVSRMPVAADHGDAGAPDDRSSVLYVSLSSVRTGAPAPGPAGAAPPAALSAGPAGGAVAPIRLTDLPADGSPVDVTVHLPAVAYQLQPGEAFEVRVTTTDQAFAGPTSPAVYRVALADGGTLQVPEAGGTRIAGAHTPTWVWIGLIVLVVIAAAGLIVAGGRRNDGLAGRRARDHRVERGPDPEHRVIPASDCSTPLVVDTLRKEYPGGVVAVDEVSFTVERGQVLGLLGPNGAGKTTALRMVMGLITPTAGRVVVFGEEIAPGAPVLSRIGSFVEGSGFLPHLSGRANLELYWRATGRPPAAAHLDDALQIAGLGAAIRRRVKTYSQGMRQRLAIAQAMLGLPDLLILDEPTNGLDPPQIHAMREVLRGYAATGRTVVVSSHLLSEVEQTCSHVVVISRGRTIADGTVADLVATSGEIQVATPDPGGARDALAGLAGLDAVEVTTTGLLVDLGAASLDSVLRRLLDAGIPVMSAAPRNRLEDVFLDLVGAGATPSGPDDPPGDDAASGKQVPPAGGISPTAGGTS